jgi:hypothetical protein
MHGTAPPLPISLHFLVLKAQGPRNFCLRTINRNSAAITFSKTLQPSEGYGNNVAIRPDVTHYQAQ